MKPTVNGNGPLIIFVNSGGCGQWMWKEVIQHLKPGYRTLTFDYDGFAGEPGVFKDMQREREKIIGLIQTYSEGQPVCIVGHSLGAQIALMVQDLADKMIVISALNHFSPALMKTTLASARWALPLTKYRWFARMQARSYDIGPEQFESYYEETKNISLEWFTNMVVANMTFEHLGPVDPEKVMVVVGEKEVKMMRDSAVTLSESPIVVSGIGHTIPFTIPEKVAEWVETFFPLGNALNE